MSRYAWTLSGGAEVADECVSSAPVMESGFMVTRSWSNVSASQSHDPCVPRPPGEVYFNVTPSTGNDALWLSVGQTVSFELDAFSDAPVDYWTVWATPPKDALAVALSQSTVNNGTKLQMTVTALKQAVTRFSIDSVGVDGTHSWPIVVLPNPF